MEIFIALSAADGFKTLMSPLGGDPRVGCLVYVCSLLRELEGTCTIFNRIGCQITFIH